MHWCCTHVNLQRWVTGLQALVLDFSERQLIDFNFLAAFIARKGYYSSRPVSATLFHEANKFPALPCLDPAEFSMNGPHEHLKSFHDDCTRKMSRDDAWFTSNRSRFHDEICSSTLSSATVGNAEWRLRLHTNAVDIDIFQIHGAGRCWMHQVTGGVLLINVICNRFGKIYPKFTENYLGNWTRITL